MFYMSMDNKSTLSPKDHFHNKEMWPRINASKEEIRSMIEKTKKNEGKVIVEIGPGNSLGVALKNNDCYIGIDPEVTGASTLNTAVNRAEIGARTYLSDDVFRLPDGIKADLVLCVAPNPHDIERDMLYEYAELIKDARAVLIAVDMRTIEATSGSGIRALVGEIGEQLEDMGRKKILSKHVYTCDPLIIRGRSINLESSNDIGHEARVIYSPPNKTMI